jgi:hypothetical protein
MELIELDDISRFKAAAQALKLAWTLAALKG